MHNYQNFKNRSFPPQKKMYGCESTSMILTPLSHLVNNYQYMADLFSQGISVAVIINLYYVHVIGNEINNNKQ